MMLDFKQEENKDDRSARPPSLLDINDLILQQDQQDEIDVQDLDELDDDVDEMSQGAQKLVNFPNYTYSNSNKDILKNQEGARKEMTEQEVQTEPVA